MRTKEQISQEVEALLDKLSVQYQDDFFDPALEPLRLAKQANDSRLNSATSVADTISLLRANQRLDFQIAQLALQKLDTHTYDTIGGLLAILSGDDQVKDAVFTDDEDQDEGQVDLKWLADEDPDDKNWEIKSEDDEANYSTSSDFSMVSSPECKQEDVWLIALYINWINYWLERHWVVTWWLNWYLKAFTFFHISRKG